MRVGSLCTGYGGLEMALPEHELAWVADTDRAASTVLAHRFPGVPNLGDLTTVDYPLAPVDVITAGFPCQPFSHAGRRAGTDDERWLWDDIQRIIGQVRPGWVVLENVRGLLSASGGHAMGRVLRGLADVGYVGSWGLVAASTVGAPHRRERVFIVAHLADADGVGWERAGVARGWGTGPADAGQSSADPAVEGPQGCGAEGVQPSSGGHGLGAKGRVRAPPDGWGPYAPAIRRWERVLRRPAPPPAVDGRLNPRMVEWMMGLPDGWVCDVPGLARTQQLKLLGNGVVPQQAAYAIAAVHDSTTP